MYPEERRTHMTAQVRAEGRVDAASLAAELNVTGETIRKDLIALERQGLLQRTHGGAILVQRLGFEPNTETRSAVHIEQKRRIATAALNELPDEGAIFLDAGTTVALLAEFLPRDRKLTVVTNSLHVLNHLVGRAECTVMALGGRVRTGSMALVDTWALRSLSEIRVDVAFIGVNGITPRHGLTTSDPTEAALKAQMFESSFRSVVLADSSKVGVDYFHRFARLVDVDILITDDLVDSEIADNLRHAGPQIVLA